MDRFPEWVIQRRGWIAAGWCALAVTLVPLARGADAKLEVGGARLGQSESEWVERTLGTRFGSPFASYALLVVADVPSPADSAGREVLGEIRSALTNSPLVGRTLSYLDANDSAFVGPRSTFLVVGLASDAPRSDDVVIKLRALTGPLQRRLRERHPRATLLWTGNAAFNYDVRLTSAGDAAAAERRVLPVVLLLLVIVFGSVVAALLPVTIGTLAIVLSLGAAVLINAYWPLAILLRNIVSMLGLGVGVDYALLTVSRFRESLADGADEQTAAANAVRHAGHTILLSGTAVAIGFAALFVVPATELRSIGAGGLLVTLIAVLLATTLLPGLLVWLGPHVERGRLWRPRRTGAAHARWHRWGMWVARRPLLVLIAGGLPMVALAWQARRVSTDIPSGNWLPPRMESALATEALQRMGHAGMLQTVRVIVELPPAGGATTEAGWSAIHRLGAAFERDPRVTRVRSFPLAVHAEHASPTLLALIPSSLRVAFMSRDERLALIELVPTERATAGDLMRLVRQLRDIDAAAVSGLAGVHLRVGGLPAFNADYQDAIGGSVTRVIGLVVGGTFLALLIGFRSLLVPLKAIALNLLSVAAAFGAAVLVFQDGHGARLLGLAAPVDGLFPAVPIIVFCIVFGLSMDYEVFLVSRVAECVRRGMPDAWALAEGMARTGGVITSAALVMIVVFAGFALGDFLLIKILGFSLGVAVLLDATVVRMAIGPALLRLAGRWNWWPGR
jgi:RND superfamily putative drug exporter